VTSPESVFREVRFLNGTRHSTHSLKIRSIHFSLALRQPRPSLVV
jgi:hypothetical protein